MGLAATSPHFGTEPHGDEPASASGHTATSPHFGTEPHGDEPALPHCQPRLGDDAALGAKRQSWHFNTMPSGTVRSCMLWLALVGCGSAPPPPPPPLPPPPPARPPERADLRAVLLGELQRRGVTEARADVALHDPYRAIERGGPVVEAWLAHERERVATQLPLDADLLTRLHALDDEYAARDLIATRAGVWIEEVGGAGRRLRELRRDDGQVVDRVELTDAVAYAPSPDGTRLALIRRDGDQLVLVVVAADSGAPIDPPIANVAAVAPAWENDGALLYVRNGGGESRVHRHRMGMTNDPVVLGSVPAIDGIRLGAAQGAAWVEAQRGEERTIWLRAGTAHFRRLPTLGAGARAAVFGSRIAVAETAEGTIRVAPLAQATRAAAWSRVAAPGVGAIAPLGDVLLVQVREHIGDGLRAMARDGTLEPVETPGAGVIRALAGDAEGAWIVWSDPMTPGELLRIDAGETAARWAFGAEGARGPATAPSGDGAINRAFGAEGARGPATAPSGDGAINRVAPATSRPRLRATQRALEVVGQDGTARELALVEVSASDAPTDLTVIEALGAFGVSAVPSFRAGVAAFLEDGGRWVFVDVRGGGGVGSTWHEEGRGAGEGRAVTDLQAAALAMRAEGRRVVLYGAGHGGLTSAGLLAREPELLAGVVLHGPVADLVRFEHFPDAALWRLEYGAPDEDDAAFRALHAISPYHRLDGRRPRPPVLVEAARTRERVAWMHGAKLAARLAEASSAPIDAPGLRPNDVSLHVDDALDDDARLARWARTIAFLSALAE